MSYTHVSASRFFDNIVDSGPNQALFLGSLSGGCSNETCDSLAILARMILTESMHYRWCEYENIWPLYRLEADEMCGEPVSPRGGQTIQSGEQTMNERQQGRGELVIYIATAVLLIAGFVLLSFLPWKGSAELHTLMELAAMCVAFFVGSMAIVRYYSNKNNTFLFVATGFIGTGLLDGYHALVTSSFFSAYLPSGLPALIPWSWVASRFFLSVCLYLSWIAWRREQSKGTSGRIDELTIYLGAGGLTLLSFVFFAFAPLPRAYYEEFFFHRPEEFVPALFFALALFGYASKGKWKNDRFEHWMLLSLIVGLVSQCLFMSRSGVLFDAMFDAAHSLKIVSYLCVLSGLMANMHRSFRKLENRQGRLQAILDTAVDAILTIDERGIVQTANPMVESLFGYPPKELVGKNIKMLMPPPYREEHDGYLAKYKQTGQANIIGTGREVIGRRKNGSTFPAFLRVGKFILNGQVCFSGTISDITELKRNEETLRVRSVQLERSNEELEQFAYVASHDLQEPLRKVSSFCELLRTDYGGQISDEADTYINFAVDGAQRMKALISDLLAFSRVATQGKSLQSVDAGAACDEAIDNLQLQIQENDGVVTRSALPAVLADHTQLVQLFQNLIGNALKYRSEQPPEVLIEVKLVDAHWVFSVSDNGIGIDPQYGERIFAIFQRLHAKGHYSGTGIGLAVCKKIVDRFGGSIWLATSEETTGSMFRFSISRDRLVHQQGGTEDDNRDTHLQHEGPVSVSR